MPDISSPDFPLTSSAGFRMSGALLPEADTAKSRWLKVGLGGCVLLAVCFGGTLLIGSDAGVSAQVSVVPLDCAQDGGDSRTTSDVSVEPAVIVPDSSGTIRRLVEFGVVLAGGWVKSADLGAGLPRSWATAK